MTCCIWDRGTGYRSAGATWSRGDAGGCSDPGKFGRNRCSGCAPCNHVPGVPNSCRKAEFYFSVPRGKWGEDATDFAAFPARKVILTQVIPKVVFIIKALLTLKAVVVVRAL